jgi:hypothetical protein
MQEVTEGKGEGTARRETEERKARVQEISQRLGTSEALAEDELKRIEMEQQKASRDRGGGMSR